MKIVVNIVQIKYLISKHDIEFEHQTNLHEYKLNNREAYSPGSNERNIKYTVSEKKCSKS